ncbi:hypothetical protein HYS91_03205 [Candidatus Daviesbacteria bacterium]|nr:hypothetical protein [Candidatus Daviesbacteria bacterium]
MIVVLLGFPLYFAPKVGAFFLEDLFNFTLEKIQEVLTPESAPANNLTLDSDISLTPNGDLDKNGEIDSGEVIRFKYKINNNTNNEYSFITLETNIPRNLLNYIHNLQGSANLSSDKNTIVIPNLRINPGEDLTIQFDARVNYFTQSDETIFTEPKLVNKDKSKLMGSIKKELKVKKLKSDQKLPSVVKSKEKP